MHAVERATLLMNDLPGISAKTLLSAGEEPGQTDLITTVKGERKVNGALRIDNHGVRSTGEIRVLPRMTLSNPMRIGDEVQLNGLFSEGNQYLRAAYSAPVGYDGLRLGGNISRLQYSLGDEFDVLEAEGDATTMALRGSYPIIRGVKNNLRVSASLAKRDYSNEQLGANVSEKEINVLDVSLNGDFVDSYWGGGINFYGTSVVVGDLDLSANETNRLLDSLGAQTEGDYIKLSWNVGRLQRWKEKTKLWFLLKGQISNKSLDSSETMSLGGPTGVRGFPVLEASGDYGATLTAEIRHALAPTLTVTGFLDAGNVSRRKTLVQPKDSTFLSSVGMSLDWSLAGKYTANISIARRVGSNPLKNPETGNDSDGTLKMLPVWVSVNKIF